MKVCTSTVLVSPMLLTIPLAIREALRGTSLWRNCIYERGVREKFKMPHHVETSAS